MKMILMFLVGIALGVVLSACGFWFLSWFGASEFPPEDPILSPVRVEIVGAHPERLQSYDFWFYPLPDIYSKRVYGILCVTKNNKASALTNSVIPSRFILTGYLGDQSVKPVQLDMDKFMDRNFPYMKLLDFGTMVSLKNARWFAGSQERAGTILKMVIDGEGKESVPESSNF
jgi:hypothetical protein